MDNPSPSLSRRIAADLLAIGAVSLSPDAPYTWASGLKAPIYCDNRLTMSYPSVRRTLTDGFETMLREHGIEPEVVVGTATAGIPHAAWLAQRLDVPLVYVRSKPKAHGRTNQVEGRIDEGQRVVVVEDLVSTGASSMVAVQAMREARADVQALLAIFSYGLQGAAATFANAGVPFYTLTTFETLLAVASRHDHLSPDALESLQAWQRDPHAWSQSH